LKITVLDGYTLNPGDLSWDGLSKLGDLTVYDHTPEEEIYSRSGDSEILFTNKTPIKRDLIERLPQLQYIGVLATGYNVVDIKAAADKGIIVTNIPNYGTMSVAQMTFALILELCHHVKEHSDAVKEGAWSRNRDFCFWRYPLIELADKTIGIIGFGRIGRQVADIATAFGMRVLAYDTNRSDESTRKDFSWADLNTLLSKSDIVSLHCPLFPETEGLINGRTLSMMKQSAFLINTSRGPLVVENDLAEALNNSQIAGAALDVLAQEPPAADNPLFSAKNCLITPHIAWATKEARSRLMEIAVENLASFIKGKVINAVNLSQP